jgi:hypothetical protein
MKTLIIDNTPTRHYEDDFVMQDWEFAPYYNLDFIKPKWNGSEYYESATPEEINEQTRNEPIRNISEVLKLTVVSNIKPNDGDVWLESNSNTGLKIRINGITKTINLI